MQFNELIGFSVLIPIMVFGVQIVMSVFECCICDQSVLRALGSPVAPAAVS